MRSFKILILLATLFMLSNSITVQAQGIFFILGGLRGLGGSGISIAPKIRSSINYVDFARLDSLEDVPEVAPKNYYEFDGEIIYSPTAFSFRGVSIPQGLSMWYDGKWHKAYTSIPKGNLKGDLEALNALQHHPDNKKRWTIDLENIDNPANFDLEGVFFRKINGEYRVEELQVTYSGFHNISLTKGLEALAYLSWSNNSKLRKIDVRLPNLIYFKSGSNNILTELSIDCPRLLVAKLEGHYNLAGFQMKCPELIGLTFSINPKMNTLDISNFAKLKSLDVTSSVLKTVDFSKNPELKGANFKTNAELISLDFSKNLKLTRLICEFNQHLTSLNVSNNPELIYLDCGVNWISMLDISKCTKLVDLNCPNNRITKLDITNNPALTDLRCYENRLSELDVSKNPALIYLWCGNNEIPELDVRNNRVLTSLWCENNNIPELDLSNNLQLKSLRCNFNHLTSLDLFKHAELEVLRCENNKLTSLDLSSQRKLKELRCRSNKLKEKSVKVCKSVVPSEASINFEPIRNSPIYDIIDCE